MENTNVQEVKMPITYDDLKKSLVDSGRPYDFAMIDRAYALAEKAHGEQRRRSGEPYICHPLSVAQILVELGMDSETIEAAIAAYEKLLAAGVPAEDARYLLPNAAETKIVITMNVRELLHFFSLRCCNRAQWEIRDMAHRMLELARPTAPFIFADAGAPCVRGTCPEGKMTCGNPYPKVTRE